MSRREHWWTDRRRRGWMSIRTRVTVQNLIMVVLIVTVIVLSARSTSVDSERALVDNVAGRQPELVFRYLSEVTSKSEGVVVDPSETFDQLRSTASALLDGGAVLAVQGNDAEVHISEQTSPVLRAKLAEEVRLVDELGAAGDRILADTPGTPAWHEDVAAATDLSRVTANVSHDAVGAMTSDAQEAVRANARLEIGVAAIGILVTLIAGWSMTRQIVNRLRAFGSLARETAAGDLSIRYESERRDEIGVLGDAFNEMSDSLAGLVARLEADADRDNFGRQLSEAFEMVDEESDALAIVTRAMQTAVGDRPVELLVADNNHSELRTVAVHPEHGGPGCGVTSPFGCVAVRRGAATVFASSDQLNACPKLQGRPGGACSAVCVPVTFMGRALGVLHTQGPNGEPPTEDERNRLATLASLSGARLGTVRAFNESQEQATTDPLTGLLNRRAIEARLVPLVAARTPFVLVMADLDHFKMLNDTYGHDAGDRALKAFAGALRKVCRTDDLVGRWGGEEFVAVIVGATLEEADVVLARLRDDLAVALESGDSPVFTSSFGVAHSHDHHGVDELIRAADVALYLAKESGRDQTCISWPPPHPERRLTDVTG